MANTKIVTKQGLTSEQIKHFKELIVQANEQQLLVLALAIGEESNKRRGKGGRI